MLLPGRSVTPQITRLRHSASDPPHTAQDTSAAGSSEPVRLRAGWHLYRGPDTAWRLCGPEDTFERLNVPPSVGAALERILCAEQSYADALAQVGEPAILAAAVDALRERGCLVSAAEATATAPQGGRVAVSGEAIIAGPLADLLRDGGVRVFGFPSDARDDVIGDAFRNVDVLVACAGWLRDEDWVRLDERAEAHGVAWHRVHCEGRRWFLGPLTIAGRTATYRDTRARRLAAARHPDELASRVAALDRPDRRPPLDPPSAAVAAIVAGLLAADVLAILAGAAPPSERHQLEFDAATLELRRHPVLPLPRGIAAMDATARTWSRAAS